jgi:hypothetical protein
MRKTTLAAGLLLVLTLTPAAMANHKTPKDESVIRTRHTNVNVLEGGVGKSKTLDVGVEVYPGPAGNTYQVDYEIVPVTASQPQDFEATIGRGTLTLNNGKATIPIKIKGDAFDELNETIRIDLSYARCTGAGICDLDSDPNPRPGYVTIADDDGKKTPGPSMTIVNGFVDARTDDECEIEVQLEYGSSENVSVNFETEDLEATKGDDYQKTEGTMVLSPGQIRKSVFVAVDRDRDGYSRNDRFLVKFSGAKGGHLSEDDGQCMFLDNGRRG